MPPAPTAHPLRVDVPGGVAIRGTFAEPAVIDLIARACGGPLPLVIADPPYGNIVADGWDQAGGDDAAFCGWMLSWTRALEPLMHTSGALYVWGGTGRPGFRPFYRYLVEVERQTGFLLASHITWSKKRAYGLAHNYLFTREELAYLHLGQDIKKPRRFQVPLLDVKRGYAGYNARYPAKSEYLRRTNVWTDVTEILRGKTHTAQKPERLHEIPIEVHTEPGEWVLDPFAGSGTTGRAARRLGRRFVLVESDPTEFDRMLASLPGPEPGPSAPRAPRKTKEREGKAAKLPATLPLFGSRAGKTRK